MIFIVPNYNFYIYSFLYFCRGYIFGLNQQQAINAITENPRKMLLKGGLLIFLYKILPNYMFIILIFKLSDSRRRGKSAVFIISKTCDENSIVIPDDNDEPSVKKMKVR